MNWEKLYSSLMLNNNNLLFRNSCLSKCLSLMWNNWRIGLVKPDISQVLLQEFPDVFYSDSTGIRLHSEPAGSEAVSADTARVFAELRKRDTFRCLRGWRNEMFAVRCRANGQILFQVERSAASLLGIAQWGCHINGYIIDKNTNQLSMWVAQRSPTKPTWPGYYDNVVAGGLPCGVAPLDNAYKEAHEEAGIPDSLLKNLRSVGTVSYFYEDQRGIFPDVEFCYDLPLPTDFQPRNADGEVSKFHLVPIQDLPKWLLDGNFKPNCALVCLDFLIRHSVINPDIVKNYEQLVEVCHTRLPLD